jgi:hypothetical protein
MAAPTEQFSVDEAKARLFKLHDRIEAGEQLDVEAAEAELARDVEEELSRPDPFLADPALDPERFS